MSTLAARQRLGLVRVGFMALVVLLVIGLVATAGGADENDAPASDEAASVWCEILPGWPGCPDEPVSINLGLCLVFPSWPGCAEVTTTTTTATTTTTEPPTTTTEPPTTTTEPPTTTTEPPTTTTTTTTTTEPPTTTTTTTEPPTTTTTTTEPPTTTTTTTTEPPTTTTTTTTTTTAAPPPPTTTTTTTTTYAGPPEGWDVVRACFENDCETAVVGLGITMAKLVSSGGNTVLFLAVGSPDDTTLLCEGFASISDLVYFDVVGDGEKRIEITLLGVGGDPDDYEACFGGEVEFTQDGGSAAAFDGNFWVGTLPDCIEAPTGPGPRLPADDAPVIGPPCVESRTLDLPTGNVTLVIVAPPGDPLVKIG